MLVNPFGLILAGLVTVGTMLKWAYDNVDWFREELIKMWKVAKSIFSGLGAAWDAFKNGDFDGLKKALSASW